MCLISVHFGLVADCHSSKSPQCSTFGRFLWIHHGVAQGKTWPSPGLRTRTHIGRASPLRPESPAFAYIGNPRTIASFVISNNSLTLSSWARHLPAIALG